MILKAKDLREKTDAELNEELASARKQLFDKRMSFHSRKLENSASMKENRKSIAKILTVIKERSLAA